MGLQTSPTCLHMTASFSNKSVLKEVRLTVKNGTKKFKEETFLLSKVSTSTAFGFLSVHHHGNNCSIFIYSMQAQQLQLSSC